MLAIHHSNFNTAYASAAKNIMRSGGLANPRGTETKELHPVIIEINNPRHRLVTAWGRPINVAFALSEVIWILSGSRMLEPLSFYNSKISDFSDDGETLNAAYGYRLRHAFDVDQIHDVIETLKAFPDSRQATLVISDPRKDRGWILGLRNDTKDRACNVLSHLMIRDGALDWLQIVRSNDLLWGTPYNWMQFTHLQEWIAANIGVPVGKFFHLADSLHIYEYHYEEAERIEEFDLYRTLKHNHQPMIGNRTHLNDLIFQEQMIRKEERIKDLEEWWEVRPNLDAYWESALPIFLAHRYYKGYEDKRVMEILFDSKTDPVYGYSQARFYFVNRWSKDPGLTSLLEEEINKRGIDFRVARWIFGIRPTNRTHR